MDLNTVSALLKISTSERDLKSYIVLQLIMLNKIEIERFSVEARELDFAIRDVYFFVHSIDIAILISTHRADTEAHRDFILCSYVISNFVFVAERLNFYIPAAVCDSDETAKEDQGPKLLHILFK